ncbi:hypothetical protein D3C83_246280 [compost metagenome]
MGERRDPLTGVVRIDRLVILPDSAPKLADVVPPVAMPSPGLTGATTPDESAEPTELAPSIDPPVEDER